MRFATTVSTDADQTALAPGYLEREWTAGGRRYFRYTMDAPILHFYSYLSARWAVARDRWRWSSWAGWAPTRSARRRGCARRRPPGTFPSIPPGAGRSS